MSDDDKKEMREQLAQRFEDWRWQVAECFGESGITDAQRRKLLDELDESIRMLRAPMPAADRDES